MGGGTDSNFIYKGIDAENIAAVIPHGWLAAQPYSDCKFSNATLESINFKPKKSTRCASLGGVTDSHSICKEIDAEDARTTTPRGWLASIDSVPTLNVPFTMQVCSLEEINKICKFGRSN